MAIIGLAMAIIGIEVMNSMQKEEERKIVEVDLGHTKFWDEEDD